MAGDVNRWDWAVTVGPFIVMFAVAVIAVRAQRKAGGS